MRAPVGVGRSSRCDEGTAAGRARDVWTRSRSWTRSARSSIISPRSSRERRSILARTRCRSRRVPAEPRARPARWRGAADTSGSEESTPTPAHLAGSVRDGLVPQFPVAGNRTASDRERALRPPPPGTARGVPPRPTSNLAAPRPRLAPPGCRSSPLRRSNGVTPDRVRVRDRGRRAERAPPARGRDGPKRVATHPAISPVAAISNPRRASASEPPTDNAGYDLSEASR